MNRDAGFDVMGRLFMHPLIGLGGLLGGFDLQLTLQYGFAETRNVVGSPVIATLSADGIYRGRTYALAFALSRRF